jgi:hypothetical protein
MNWTLAYALSLMHDILFYSLSTALIGDEDSCIPGSVEMKTNGELKKIAERTQNSFLMHHVLLNQMCTMCYFRNHLAVVEPAEMHYATKQKGKRALDILPQFYEGLCKSTSSTMSFSFSPRCLNHFICSTSNFSASLSLARQTKDKKWRAIGKKAAALLARTAMHGTWTFENKHLLLQAELYYLVSAPRATPLSCCDVPSHSVSSVRPSAGWLS